MQSSGFDLGSFLAEQARAGQAESSGEFSVAYEKAMEKLSHYSLAGAYTWILKLLQSLALWHPHRLTVTQSTEFTSFHFCPKVDFPKESDITDSFQHGFFQKDSPLSQLCMALRALVEQAELSFVLSINGDTPSHSPIYSGDDVSKFSENERLRWAHHTERGLHLVVSHYKGKESITGRIFPTFTRLDRRDLKIAGVLEENCVFHPVPIWLDGRHLNSPATHAKYGITTKNRTIAMWGAQVEYEGLQRLTVPENYEGRLFSVHTSPARATRSYTGFRDFDCWFLLKARAPGRLNSTGFYLTRAQHEILWIKNGVVVERARARGLSKLVETTILLSAEGYGTDLSGLALGRSEKREQAQAHALNQVSEQLQRLAEGTHFLNKEDRDEQSLAQEPMPDFVAGSFQDDIVPSLGFGVIGGAYTLGAVPFLTGALIGAGSMAAVSFAVRKRRQSASVQEALRAEWVELVRQDLQALPRLNTLRFKADSGSGGGLETKQMFQPKAGSNTDNS